jgi:hypothetical protein
MKPSVRHVVLNLSLEQQVRSILKRSGGSLYLPSPATTFQDSAGEIPGAVDAPVGFLMDIGQGGLSNIGPNQITNGTFDSDTTGWTTINGMTIASVSGQMQCTLGAAGFPSVQFALGAISSGEGYRIEFDYNNTTSHGIWARLENGTIKNIPSGTSGHAQILSIAQSNSANTKVHFMANSSSPTAGQNFIIDNVTAHKVPGRHFYQLTTANKPVLRQTSGRYWMDMADGTDLLTMGALTGYTAATLIHSVLNTGQITLENQNISAGYSWTQDNSAGLIICPTAPSPRNLVLLQRYMSKLAGV